MCWVSGYPEGLQTHHVRNQTNSDSLTLFHTRATQSPRLRTKGQCGAFSSSSAALRIGLVATSCPSTHLCISVAFPCHFLFTPLIGDTAGSVSSPTGQKKSHHRNIFLIVEERGFDSWALLHTQRFSPAESALGFTKSAFSTLNSPSLPPWPLSLFVVCFYYTPFSLFKQLYWSIVDILNLMSLGIGIYPWNYHHEQGNKRSSPPKVSLWPPFWRVRAQNKI